MLTKAKSFSSLFFFFLNAYTYVKEIQREYKLSRKICRPDTLAKNVWKNNETTIRVESLKWCFSLSPLPLASVFYYKLSVSFARKIIFPSFPPVRNAETARTRVDNKVTRSCTRGKNRRGGEVMESFSCGEASPMRTDFKGDLNLIAKPKFKQTGNRSNDTTISARVALKKLRVSFYASMLIT